MIIFAFSEKLLCIYLATRDCRRKHSKNRTFSLTYLGVEIHRSSRVFTWLILRKWRTRCKWIFFSTTLTLWMESWSGNQHEDILKRLKEASNSYVTTISDMSSFFIFFRCCTCDKIFPKTGSLERHLITCSERVRHIYPKNVHQLRETLFENLDSFNIQFREEQKLFEKMPFSISNLFALRKRRIEKLQLQNGLRNISLHQFQFRQT